MLIIFTQYNEIRLSPTYQQNCFKKLYIRRRVSSLLKIDHPPSFKQETNLMALQIILLLCFISASFELSTGAVYKVGDSAGWTIIGNVDYNSWAATKTFRAGDIIGIYMHCSLVFP